MYIQMVDLGSPYVKHLCFSTPFGFIPTERLIRFEETHHNLTAVAFTRMLAESQATNEDQYILKTRRSFSHET